MKKFLIVTDEGCYSDYGFHMAIVSEETAKLILSKYLEAKEKCKEIIENDSYSWRAYIKHPRHIQEVSVDPLFSDVKEEEWSWLSDEEIAKVLKSYDVVIEHGWEYYDDNKYELDLR